MKDYWIGSGIIGDSMMDKEYESTALILTAVIVETESVKKLYGDWKRVIVEGDSQEYYETYFERDGKKHRIITTQQDVMGMTASAIVALKAINIFKPRYVFLSGIAAGTGDEVAQMYGDVIVPDQIWDYTTGKFVGPDESEIRFGDLGFLPRPTSVFIDESLIDIVRNTIGLEDNEFHIHIGPMACGSSVIANRDVVDKQVLAMFPHTMGLDMESYSVAFAAEKSAEPRPKALIVKSICDFANSEKSDQYQKFAAFTSSRYIKYLLDKHLPV